VRCSIAGRLLRAAVNAKSKDTFSRSHERLARLGSMLQGYDIIVLQ
jgi:hypothetical protein